MTVLVWCSEQHISPKGNMYETHRDTHTHTWKSALFSSSKTKIKEVPYIFWGDLFWGWCSSTQKCSAATDSWEEYFQHVLLPASSSSCFSIPLCIYVFVSLHVCMVKCPLQCSTMLLNKSITLDTSHERGVCDSMYVCQVWLCTHICRICCKP